MIQHTEQTTAKNVSLQVERRPGIKLRNAPNIVVCMPVGGTEVSPAFKMNGQTHTVSGFRAPAVVPVQWALSHMRQVPPLNASMTYMAQWGMLSAPARQLMTMKALELDPDYLLYWDCDTLPVSTIAIFTLFNELEQRPDVAVIGGAYVTRTDPPVPLIFKEHGDGSYWNFSVEHPEDVFAIGSGFMMVRAKAIRDLLEKESTQGLIWSDEYTAPDDGGQRITWGHDIRLCRMMWEAGWKVMVDGRVICDHYDIYTGITHRFPENSAPAKRQRNINTQAYWDKLYTKEGVDSWRKYPQMFEEITNEIESGESVVELGCGVGILGSRLSAQRGCRWRGFDTSLTAVEACRARFLTAERKEVKDLTSEDLEGANTVISTELVEHLIPQDREHLFGLIKANTSIEKFIFSVPNGGMPPEVVPEHEIDCNREMVEGWVSEFAGFKSKISIPDESHLLVILERVPSHSTSQSYVTAKPHGV